MNTRKTLEKVYEPADVEGKWSKRWLEAGLFTAAADAEGPPFSMVIPPPNITGSLHLGHALNNTLQDITARFKRMKGYNVLWVPGIDHAGIATQNVVERQLKGEGLDRHRLGREGFIERVWQWKDASGGTIINQLKRLGASCDWTRERFTMDEGLSSAVKEVFARLYADGLIYRGDYIINWCPRCHTALSDLEVETEERDSLLWHLDYPARDGKGRVTVATTRPETMLGDTAVAVNPGDERYRELVGRTLMLPLMDREIPVVADESVDMEFGTGAVKITPAHDFNDFDISKRHNLPLITVMDQDARMNENAGPYRGLTREEARKRVVEDLKEKGLLRKEESYRVRLGSCYRCATVVEPRLSKQWFVRVGPLADEAMAAVEDGRTKFIPKNWENTYFEWMKNIRDWCISRQIWWGHRIPAWYCSRGLDHVTVSTGEPTECEKCGDTNLTQDPDVLDTWFSSALWPFSTLGWPDRTDELKTFYPTSALFTSFDIIFFWVARMMMMGLKFMGDVPFKEVYIHALIRDASGQKMSKSRGNVIDPLVMMDRFGTDAVRFTLAAFAAQGRDIRLAEDRIEGYRNFTNKLWNLARFALMNIDDDTPSGFTVPVGDYTAADKWIVTRLTGCINAVETAIGGYRFDAAAKALYAFVWHELCDWYVELIKTDLRGENGPGRKKAASGVLLGVLEDTLKLLHPFMPFITDEIYSCLPATERSLLEEEFPPGRGTWPEEEAHMERILDVIRAVRNVRTEMNITPKTELDCVCIVDDEALREALRQNENHLKNLARTGEVKILEKGEPPRQAAYAALDGVELYVPLKGRVDLEGEIARLTKKLGETAGASQAISKKISNRNFLEKAPEEVVEKERQKLAELADMKEKIEGSLERLRSLV